MGTIKRRFNVKGRVRGKEGQQIPTGKDPLALALKPELHQ